MSSQYCIMNVAKRQRVDVRGLQKEANRELPEGKYKSNVDLSKSGQNVKLVYSADWNKSINDVLQKHGVKTRSNSTVLLTSVYSASPEWFAEHTREEAIEYFKSCLEYERSRGGEVISAIIHFDETTPHMQIATVPITTVAVTKSEPVQKRNEAGEPMFDATGNPIPERYESGKMAGKIKYAQIPVFDGDTPVTRSALNAKEIIGNRVKMSREQTRFHEMCGKSRGMERGKITLLTDEDAAEHIDEVRGRAKAEADAITKSAADSAAEIEQNARQEATAIKAKQASKWRQIHELTIKLEAALDDLSAADDDTPRGRWMKRKKNKDGRTMEDLYQRDMERLRQRTQEAKATAAKAVADEIPPEMLAVMQAAAEAPQEVVEAPSMPTPPQVERPLPQGLLDAMEAAASYTEPEPETTHGVKRIPSIIAKPVEETDYQYG